MTKPTILCVDDEKDNIEALERLFRKKFNVLKATSGKEAFNLLDQHREPVAVIITDQRMPEMTGVEFLEKTLEKYPDTLRMLLTGYTDLESVIAAVNKGQIYRYITKPWDPVDIVNTVDQACDRYFLGIELKEKNVQLSRAIEELKSLDQAKSNFMILINHELKTPLTSIINFASLLKETKLDTDQNHYLQRIISSTDRLKNLIEDVLLIMKSETNQLKLDIQNFSLKTVEPWITEDLQKLMQQKNITLSENFAGKDCSADRRLLSQIFHKLIHNAIKFGNPGRPITVTSEDSANGVLFKVFNKGPQISNETIKKVFQPFYIDENILNHSTGFGLGLTICKSLLKLQGASLNIQNHMNGVCVSFELPKK